MYYSRCFYLTIMQKVRRFQKICYLCCSAYGTGHNTRTRPSKLLRYGKNPLAWWAAQTNAVARIWSKAWKISMGYKNPEM